MAISGGTVSGVCHGGVWVDGGTATISGGTVSGGTPATDAAGAVADGDTLTRSPDAQRYLDRNDSYRYFDALGDLIRTGPTNTNVMDVRVVLIGGKK